MVLITTEQYIDLLENKLLSLHSKTSNVGILQRMAHIQEIQVTFNLLRFYKGIEVTGELKELESPIVLTSN